MATSSQIYSDEIQDFIDSYYDKRTVMRDTDFDAQIIGLLERARDSIAIIDKIDQALGRSWCKKLADLLREKGVEFGV